jgi:hypothetical protein
MAKIVGKAAIVTVDDSGGVARIISTDVTAFEINDGLDVPEVTGFSETVTNYIPGQKQQSIRLTCLWNTAATTGSTTVLRGILGSATSKTVAVQPEGTGLTFSGEFMLKSFTPAGQAASGAIQLGVCEFVPMGSTAAAWA